MAFSKDPSAVLDYVFDWSAWLDDTDQIIDATVTAPDGITIDSQSFTASAVTVWLSGGTVGTQYRVVCQITTADGRVDERTTTISVRER